MMEDILNNETNNIKTIKKKKSLFIALIILLIVVSILFTAITVMLSNVEENIVGTWSSNRYFTEYNGKIISETIYSVMEFRANGTYAAIRGNRSGSILEYKEGTWDVSGFRITVDIKNQLGDTVYSYNPLTDKMESGVWVYERNE